MKKIIINLPKSHRTAQKFHKRFTNKTFIGKTSLFSGRDQYAISLTDFEKNKNWLKLHRITKNKEQWL